MYAVAVTVFVKPDKVEPFIQAILANARGARQEPGNLRFDVSQAEAEPTKFLIYEVYKTKDDFTAHQQTAHYITWRDTVTDWMAQPRQGVRHNTLFFDNQETK